MFTGIIRVERLKREEVNDHVVSDINALLHRQRGDARMINKVELLEKMHKMSVVVAWNDRDRIIGLGVLTQSGGLNFDCAEIRHLVIDDGQDNLAIGMRIMETLHKIYVHCIEHIEVGVWIQDEEMIKIFKVLGYKEKPSSRFRLRFPKTS